LGDGEADLLGEAADPSQIMCLLSAIDPDRLSADVINRFCIELGTKFNSWTALPRPIYDAMCEHTTDVENEYERMKEITNADC
jgi:hypothetical protein